MSSIKQGGSINILSLMTPWPEVSCARTWPGHKVPITFGYRSEKQVHCYVLGMNQFYGDFLFGGRGC